MSQLAIPARRSAGAVARRAVATWIAGHPRLDDALLAVTELVNNAVIHSGLPSGSRLTVGVEPDGEALRLTVAHDGVSFDLPDSLRPSTKAEASRGLAIVDMIADSWGVESSGGAVSAWFEIRPRKSDARIREGSSEMGLGPQLVLETTRIGEQDVIVVTGEIDLASSPRVELAPDPPWSPPLSSFWSWPESSDPPRSPPLSSNVVDVVLPAPAGRLDPVTDPWARLGVLVAPGMVVTVTVGWDPVEATPSSDAVSSELEGVVACELEGLVT